MIVDSAVASPDTMFPGTALYVGQPELGIWSGAAGESIIEPRVQLGVPVSRWPVVFETLTTVTFEARSGQTLLTFIDAGFPTGEDRRMFQTGTVAVPDAFKRVVETSTA